MIAAKKFSFSVIKEKPIFSFFILYFGIVLVWWEKLCPEKKKWILFLESYVNSNPEVVSTSVFTEFCFSPLYQSTRMKKNEQMN